MKGLSRTVGRQVLVAADSPTNNLPEVAHLLREQGLNLFQIFCLDFLLSHS